MNAVNTVTHEQTAQETAGLPRIRIGMAGLEEITHGGLPRGRTILVTGRAGTGKTVLACQYLAAGIEAGEQSVFVSMEEGVEATRQNAGLLGFDFATWEREGPLHILQAGSRSDAAAVVTGDFDFGGLLAQIREVVNRAEGAPVRVVIDSLSAAFLSYPDQRAVREALRSAIQTLNTLGVTTLMIAERSHDQQEPGYGLEEYLASVSVVLSNDLAGSHRQRTLEVLKARGIHHMTGRFPFIIAEGGLHLLPVSYGGEATGSSPDRVAFDVAGLDTLCPEGVYSDSLIVVSGPAGSGKTSLAVEFALAAPRSILYSFEESTGQLRRNAGSRGIAVDEAVDTGRIELSGASAREASIDHHYMAIDRHVRQRRPPRLVVDGLAVLEKSTDAASFYRFVERLSALSKAVPTLILCTYTMTSEHRESVTGLHASPAVDGIVALRYLFREARMQRYLTVVKMRGDNHDTSTRLLLLDDQGLHLGDPVDAALF